MAKSARLIHVELDGNPMVVYDDSEGKAMVSDDAPHSYYCARRKDVLADASAFKEVCRRLDASSVDSVLELFGGSGWHSLFIQQIFSPKMHLAIDISPACVESIKRSLPAVKVIRANSYDLLNRMGKAKWDWIHADFNQYTYKRSESEPYKGAVANIFARARRYVTITDSAVFGLVRFARNRASYSNSIGMDTDDWKDYYRAVAERYAEQYGFGVRHVIVWHRMASMLLLEQGAVADDFEVVEQKTKLPFVIKKIKGERL